MEDLSAFLIDNIVYDLSLDETCITLSSIQPIRKRCWTHFVSKLPLCCTRSKKDLSRRIVIRYHEIVNVNINTHSDAVELEIVQADTSHRKIRYWKLRSFEEARAKFLNRIQILKSAILKLAFDGIEYSEKRFICLINPAGGKGNALSLYQKHVQPIFVAAKCHVTTIITQYQNHAYEITSNMDLKQYDAIVCVSGDGLPSEVFNGLANHVLDTHEALKIPVAHLPAGSGNAMALNSFGVLDIFKCTVALLKSKPTPLDLIKVSQGPRSQLYSFLSITYGLIADCDIGTESLRWLGPIRFDLGVIYKGFFRHKAYEAKLRLRDAVQINTASPFDSGDAIEEYMNAPLSMFGAGKMKFLADGVKYFPDAEFSDGMIDIIIVPSTASRFGLVQMMRSVESGQYVNSSSVKYYKCKGFELETPQTGSEIVSIDGEKANADPMICEIKPSMARILTCKLTL